MFEVYHHDILKSVQPTREAAEHYIKGYMEGRLKGWACDEECFEIKTILHLKDD